MISPLNYYMNNFESKSVQENCKVLNDNVRMESEGKPAQSTIHYKWVSPHERA